MIKIIEVEYSCSPGGIDEFEVYLNGDYVYEFNGPRTIENLKNFVFNGNYEQAESEPIPIKLEGIALYQKQFIKFLGQY